MAFRCGHDKTPENSIKNGGTSVRCRICHNEKTRLAESKDPEATKLRKRESVRKSRGGLKGHRNSQKTHCSNNHEFTVDNTYSYKGIRGCITCRLANAVTYHHNKVANGGSHSTAEWLELCELFGGVCLSCLQSGKLTRDHVVPVSVGGTNDIENIQPLCQSCNSAKGTNTIDLRSPVLIRNLRSDSNRCNSN